MVMFLKFLIRCHRSNNLIYITALVIQNLTVVFCEIISFDCVFHYVSHNGYRKDARRFVLEMDVSSIAFMFLKGGLLLLTAVCTIYRCLLYWRSQGVTWCCCPRDQTDTQFVDIEEEEHY